jgi:hypothetical protein
MVARGRLGLRVGAGTCLLEPDDAFFSSRIPHRFRNLGQAACEVVAAAAPPSF